MHKPKKQTEELLALSISYAVMVDNNGVLVPADKMGKFVEVGDMRRQVRVLFTEAEINERLPFKGLVMRVDDNFQPLMSRVDIYRSVNEIYQSVQNG